MPFIPFIHSPQDIIFLFFILMRVTGFFLVSPLFANKAITMPVKVLLTVFVAILIALPLYPLYRGDNPQHIVPILVADKHISMLALMVMSIKELAIGYLMGLIFTLVFEALLVAGQLSSVLMGFAIMSIIDPMSGEQRPILAQMFVIFITLLILAFDLHHVFFRELANSFVVLPLGNYHMPYEMLHDIIKGSSRLFTYAMQYIAIPYFVLFLVTVGLGFIAKIMPQMNIFILGFPIKLLIGYYTLIVAVGYFPQVLQRSFVECDYLVRHVVRYIAGG